jgi:arsenite-transporting ATPase
MQEVNINHEIKNHWSEISAYVTALLRKTGMSGVEAEEMAIFPGMEELSAMMYVNQYRRSEEFEAIVLDCAPTAESIRFVSLPSTLDWYMKHVFGLERTMMRAVRPIARHLSPVELPPDRYFQNLQDLFDKVEGVDRVLEDPAITSVRLVTNAEKMVLRETQRAFVYFNLHGLMVDHIIVNRLIPESVQDPFFQNWQESQRHVLEEIERYFSPIPVRQVPMFSHEVLGLDRLAEMAIVLYGQDDPSAISRTTPPYMFAHVDDHYEVRIDFPFAAKAEIGLFKKNDELVIEVGTLRRHVGLPTTMASLEPVKAALNERMLVVEMREPK